MVDDNNQTPALGSVTPPITSAGDSKEDQYVIHKKSNIQNVRDQDTGQEQEQLRSSRRCSNKWIRATSVVLLLISITTIVVVVVILIKTVDDDSSSSSSSSSDIATTTEPTLGSSTSNPSTSSPTNIAFTSLKDLISNVSFDSSRDALLDPSSPQYEALKWLSDDPNIDNYDDSQTIQRFVLATLFYSTGGHDHWNTSSSPSSTRLLGARTNNNDDSAWLNYSPSSTAECSWYTTSQSTNDDICDSNGNIVELHLQENNLVGTLPPELALLSNSLTTLVLAQNKLTGTIPTELGLLQFLETLDLSSNNLSGSIPSELGSLSFFQYVALNDNESLEGSIPYSQICEQTIIVDCSNVYCPCCNKECMKQYLSAISPDSGLTLANRTSPQYEAFEWLTSLPQQENMMKMSKSRIIQRYALATFYKSTNIDGSEWSCGNNDDPASQCDYSGWLGMGDVCDSWSPISWNYYPYDSSSCDDTGLVLALDLDEYVCCGGTIPREIGLLTTLETFTIQMSYLSGIIPSEIGFLTNLEILDISSQEHLMGPIPSEIGRLTKLERLNLEMNYNFAGSLIPTEIGNLIHLESLSLNGNFHEGQLPSEIGTMVALEHFDMAHNNINGPLPSEIGIMESLEYVNCPYNSLTGDIPSEIGNLQFLEFFHISYNDISGSLPSELGLLTNLEKMIIHHNQIVGKIPSTFGELQSLMWLELQENMLTGSIPTECGQLQSLESLTLHNNNLIRSIPTELGLLASVASIDLTSNSLTGKIPSELGMLTTLSSLYIAANNMSGQIPTDLGQLTDLYSLNVSHNELTGQIPFELGLTGFWYHIDFRYNSLSGIVPQAICDIGIDLRGFELFVDCDEVLCTCCVEECLKSHFRKHSLDNGVALDTEDSPQHKAFQWLKSDLYLARFTSVQRIVERYVLATFYYSTTIKNNWTCGSFDECDMPLWMSDKDVCDIEGWSVYDKECNDDDLLVKLDFSDILCCGGMIPPELALLKNLEYLELDRNWLSGSLPTELGVLHSSLKHMVIKNQEFLNGTIPSEFGLLTGLTNLNLHWNSYLEGPIPFELGQLSKLQIMMLSYTSLSGSIPTEVSGMTSLENLHLEGTNVEDGLENFCTTDIPLLENFVADCQSLSCSCCSNCFEL